MHMDLELFTIGVIFFAGLSADLIGSRTAIPRVTFLIVIGVVLGPFVTNLIAQEFIDRWFDGITMIALSMIGFLLGEQFTLKNFKSSARRVMFIALGKVLLAFILISITMLLMNLPIEISLLIASIASATAPTAIYEVVHELKIDNKFSKTLLSIVALDDVLALFLFSIVLSLVGAHSQELSPLILALKEISLSLVLGFGVGFFISRLTGRVGAGEPSMIEALGSIFLITGLALYFEVSSILAAMAMGSSVATFAKHHNRPFHEIENIEWIFMVLFFILAGATLELESILNIGYIGIVYIVVRILGFYIGATLGAKLGKSSKEIQKYIGLSLIPQAGVAIGMALMASHVFPQYSTIILPLILGTTVIFELIGPIVVRWTLIQSIKKEEK
jgi:Kef-type K+ transport system membrane component KefB